MDQSKNVERHQGLYELKTKSGIILQIGFDIDLLGEHKELENGTAKLLRPLTKEEADEVMNIESELFQVWSASLEEEAEG